MKQQAIDMGACTKFSAQATAVIAIVSGDGTRTLGQADLSLRFMDHVQLAAALPMDLRQGGRCPRQMVMSWLQARHGRHSAHQMTFRSRSTAASANTCVGLIGRRHELCYAPVAAVLLSVKFEETSVSAGDSGVERDGKGSRRNGFERQLRHADVTD